MTCAAPAVPAEPPERYRTFFDVTLAQPAYSELAKAYGSELPWETVRTEEIQQGDELL